MEDEPEPCPDLKPSGGGRGTCRQQLNRYLSLIMQTHFQLLQLAADVAALKCYFSSCAPLFLGLAERTKKQAGSIMDIMLRQGSSIALPAIDPPCPNLAMDHVSGEQTLGMALEACLQLEAAKKLEEFSEAVREQGNVDVRALADALSSDTRRVQAGLLRMHSAVLHSQSKLEGLVQVEKLMSD